MSGKTLTQVIEQWLHRFELHPLIAQHTAAVLHALPEHIRDDFIFDPHFIVHDYDPDHHEGVHAVVALPDGRAVARSVVLKRTLVKRSAAFVRWLIAHELAHAHLRNAGRWEGEDPEDAADALAASWGFPRPARSLGR